MHAADRILQVPPIILYIGGLILLLLLYLPAITNNYAFLDDATQAFGRTIALPMNIDYYAIEGRPLYGFLLNFWRSLPDIAFLANFRALSLGFLLGIYLLHLHLLRDLFPAPFSRVCVAISIASLPALALQVLWTSMFQAMFAFLLSLLAGMAALRFIVQLESCRSRSSVLQLLALPAFSVLSLLTALMLYQPMAEAYFAILLYYLLSRAIKSHYVIRDSYRIFLALLPYGIASILYLAWYKSGLFPFSIMDAGDEFILSRGSRATFTTDPLGKLDWFFSGPLHDALQLHFVFQNQPFDRIFVTLVVSVIVGALYSIYKSKFENLATFCIWLASIGILAIASLQLHLLLAESPNSFRIMVGLSLIIAVLFFSCSAELLKRLSLHRNVIGLLFFAYMGTASMYAYHNYKRYFIRPAVAEYNTVAEAVGDLLADQRRDFVLIKPGWHYQPINPPLNLEFGTYTTAHWWAAETYFKLIAYLKTGDPRYFRNIIVVDPHLQETQIIDRRYQDFPVIDLNHLLAKQDPLRLSFTNKPVE